jgi:ABC-2 type transport system permease protein
MTAPTVERVTGSVSAGPVTGAVTGAVALARLALRRDRIILPVWVVGFGLMMWAVVASVQGLYPTAEERAGAAAFAAGSVVARAFDGPAAGTSLGALTLMESYVLLAVLIGLMSTFSMVRHTRQNEETGRAELIGAAVVGRHALLVAAVLVTLGAASLAGAATTVVLLAHGLPVIGSVLTGVGLLIVGACFAGVAAVTAQVFDSARAANATAGAAVGLAFFLRAIGDAAGELAASGVEVISAWPSWWSPIGWAQQVRPFHLDRVAPLALGVTFAMTLLVVAAVLESRRDVGSGMLGTRPGPARGGSHLLSPLGLAWRLQRGVALGWLAGIVVLAGSFAALGDEAGEFITTSEQLADAFAAMAGGADLVDTFLGFMMALIGTVAGGFIVQVLLRLRTEEATGTLEPLLSTAVGRTRWLASHVTIAIVGVVVILLSAGVAAGLSYGVVSGDLPAALATLTAAALVHLPASLTLIGIVVVGFAVVPRWAAALAWTVFTVCLLLGQIGALLDLPQAVLNISPYTHTPAIPAVDLTWLPLVILATVGVGSVGVGAGWFRRRDLQL